MKNDPRIDLAEALWNDPRTKPLIMEAVRIKFPNFRELCQGDESLERMWDLPARGDRHPLQ